MENAPFHGLFRERVLEKRPMSSVYMYMHINKSQNQLEIGLFESIAIFQCPSYLPALFKIIGLSSGRKSPGLFPVGRENAWRAKKKGLVNAG